MMSFGEPEIAVTVDGTGPAVLLLHGIGGSFAVYQAQARALAEAGSAWCVSTSPVPGTRCWDRHPSPSTRTPPTRLRFCPNWTSIERSWWVTRWGRWRSDLVSGLVLVEAPALPAAALIHDRADRIRELGSAAVAEQILDVSVSAKTHVLRPDVTAFIRDLIRGQDSGGYAANNDASAGASDPGEIAADLSVLLVVGERDTLSPPKLSARIAAGHENRTLDVVPGIGHWIPLEAPSQLAELLTSFAARTRFVR
jgi:pimeloyl-ACP methyl ester carboxylesterase